MHLEKNQVWTPELYRQFQEYLQSCQDLAYRDFQGGLIPGCSKPLIGVRMPLLRKLAKDISATDWQSFLALCQDTTYEEIMVRGLLIGALSLPPEEYQALIESQVPLIDNWAFCDAFCGAAKTIRSHRAYFFPLFSSWTASPDPWRVRVALVMFLEYFLEPDYIDTVIALCDSVSSEHYYVRMAQAWLLSMCYVHFRDKTLAYLRSQTRLDPWTYNKALQKCRESFRVSPEDKALLKIMRRKA